MRRTRNICLVEGKKKFLLIEPKPTSLESTREMISVRKSEAGFFVWHMGIGESHANFFPGGCMSELR